MTSTIDALGIRRRLGREIWSAPDRFGPDGWTFRGLATPARIIVTAADHDGAEWWHASISRPAMPTYADLVRLHRAVWPNGWAYQVFAPPADHVNIHSTALHLWGAPDRQPPRLPNFGALGTI